MPKQQSTSFWFQGILGINRFFNQSMLIGLSIGNIYFNILLATDCNLIVSSCSLATHPAYWIYDLWLELLMGWFSFYSITPSISIVFRLEIIIPIKLHLQFSPIEWSLSLSLPNWIFQSYYHNILFIQILYSLYTGDKHTHSLTFIPIELL